ncbi:8025_t:CDS:2 [Racocetra fulgida]|uniref:8025_t:CDS:1 n=1 Tax=Racocetra fulgida TaxID=60492 RepID=A0A9N8VRP7_9GLOM|nr:8025_t:CDS:2 [Racocetra fulgida]
MHLHELYRQLKTNANVYPEIEKVCKFTTGLRTKLQIAVCLFGENTWDGVVKRAKTCELTHYSAAKLSVNTEGPDASQDNTNPSMLYLKEEDKNNINEAYVEKRRKVVEENKTPEVQNIVVNDTQAEIEAIFKGKTKESSNESESKYESSSESDESTEYEDEQLEERIYILNLCQEIEKENLKQICLYYSFDPPSKLNVEELNEKQQEEFYDLVNEYIDIFAQNNSDLGRTNEIQHEIEMQYYL